MDVDSFDPVTTETVLTPSLHTKGDIPKEGELVVIKDSSTDGYPGGVLHMQYHSTLQYPNFFLLRQVTKKL